MGREVKRVAMNFNWPLKKRWHGYGNPHYKPCPHCQGGYSAAYKHLEEPMRLLLRACEVSGNADAITIAESLCGRKADKFIGFCGTATYSALLKLAELAGLPENWKVCAQCKGDGIDPCVKEAHDAWKPTEPPVGDGWQMWETTSEGSPISPVFATPEELARWLAITGASAFGRSTATYEQWLAMIGAGWSPSMVVADGAAQIGVEFIANRTKE